MAGENFRKHPLTHDNDNRWQEEASGTEWPSYKTVLMEAPASKETKLAMINQVFIKPQTWNRPLKPLVKMSAHINPVFTDRSVHMMMVVLALFHSDDQDESVRRVHEVINK